MSAADDAHTACLRHVIICGQTDRRILASWHLFICRQTNRRTDGASLLFICPSVQLRNGHVFKAGPPALGTLLRVFNLVNQPELLLATPVPPDRDLTSSPRKPTFAP